MTRFLLVLVVGLSVLSCVQMKIGSADDRPSIKVKIKKERLYQIKLSDPAMSEKWGLEQISWKEHKDSDDVVVAVIDTGIDVDHPDLKNMLWTNDREIPNNNIDDDGNGFVDDIHGWNFAGAGTNLTDNHGHGTHIAGIIGAEPNNGVGIAGVASNVKIMVLKYYDPLSAGRNNLLNTVRSIDYAVKMGADIINYSGGGLDESPEEKAAIARAKAKGIIVVAAAGNERSNSDNSMYFPASYDFNNIVSVTAVNKQKRVLASSNYGVRTVDLAAPGNNIYSTLPNSRYGYMTGTSQATAFVTGVIAVLKGKYPGAWHVDIISAVTDSVVHEKYLDSKAGSGGILNMERAIRTMELREFLKNYEKLKTTS